MNHCSSPPPISNKNYAIEYLRAVAIILTIAQHLPGLFYWGDATLTSIYTYATFWTGVDLFFCISGYVITLSVMDKIPGLPTPAGQRSRHLAIFAIPFWIRRAWRLWPNALLWIVIPAVGSLTLQGSGAFALFRPFLSDALAALLHVANFHWSDCFALKHGLCGSPSPIGVYWSLSLEEQFYFAFPFLAILLGAKKLPWLLAALIVIQFPVERSGWSLWFAIRTDALCIGVLIALFTRSPIYDAIRPSFSSKWQKHAVQLALIVLLMVLPAAPAPVRFSTGLVAIICGLLVWLASYDTSDTREVRRTLRSKLVLWIASRSYSLYLIHMSAFAFTRAIWFYILPAGTTFNGHHSLRFAITALILLIAATELSYRFVETPCRRKGVEISKRMDQHLRRTLTPDR